MEQNKDQSGAGRALPSDLTEREEIDLLCQVETYMSVTDKHSQTHPEAEAEEARIYSLVNGLIAKRFSDIGAAVRGEAVAEELKLLHRGGHSPSTSGNGIAKSWMDELDQSREYMRGYSEKSSTSGASAAANELVDSSKPPAGLDQREQMIWMMGRNSKESSVSVRAADAPSKPSELPTLRDLAELFHASAMSNTAVLIHPESARSLFDAMTTSPKDESAPLSYVCRVEPHQDRIILDDKYESIDTVRGALAKSRAADAPSEPSELPICRDDGRCQYAIDHQAEGMGHCPAGKCCMPDEESVSLETACRNLIVYLDNNPPMGESLLCVRQIRNAIDSLCVKSRAADALDSQPTEPWTRTEDHLPPVETPVFIVHSDDVKIGEIRWENPSHEETFEAFMYWDDPNDDGQSWDWLEVTHWMPIPPAPASRQPTDGGVRND